MWENSLHFATPPRVTPRSNVWETSTKIPYWWRSLATHILVLLLIGWRTFRSRLTKKHYPDLGSDPSSVWNLCSLCSDVILRENHSCFRWVSILRLTKRQTFWRHLKRSTRCHQEGSKWGGSFDDWRLYFSNFHGWRLNFRAFDGWRLFSGTDFVHELH